MPDSGELCSRSSLAKDFHVERPPAFSTGRNTRQGLHWWLCVHFLGRAQVARLDVDNVCLQVSHIRSLLTAVTM